MSIQMLRSQLNRSNWKGSLKLTIPFAVLFLAALLGWKISPRIPILLVGALLAGLAYVFLTRHTEWGILALFPASFLIPWTLSSGTHVPINATILLLGFLFGVWILRMIILKRDVRLIPSPINTPAVLFLFSVSISLIVGFFPLIPSATEKASLFAQIGGWLLYTFSVGSLLLVGNFLRDIRWLKTMTWIFLILGGVYTGLVLPFGLYRVNAAFFGEGISTSIFWTLLAVIGFGQAFSNRDLPLAWRLVAGGISMSGLVFGWVRGREWIAGWLPPVIAVYIFLWLRSWKLGLGVTLVVSLVMFPIYPQILEKINTPTQQWSSYTRFLTWPIMFELIKASPIFGLGPANYYHYTPLYAIYGYYVNFNSHNNYLDILAQTGIVGMGLFLWVVFALTRLGLRLRKRVRDGFSLGYINSALAGLLGCLVAGTLADWFLPFLYNIGFAGFRTSVLAWLFLGGLLSLDAIHTQQGS